MLTKNSGDVFLTEEIHDKNLLRNNKRFVDRNREHRNFGADQAVGRKHWQHVLRAQLARIANDVVTKTDDGEGMDVAG